MKKILVDKDFLMKVAEQTTENKKEINQIKKQMYKSKLGFTYSVDIGDSLMRSMFLKDINVIIEKYKISQMSIDFIKINNN